ncbi:MAG: dioxygenase [Leptospiraceae bacterium]|nr:dioxygenase [Leptospiraceae bacterium]
MPLLEDVNHKMMIEFLEEISEELEKPSAIVVFSAHWEEDSISITSSNKHELLFDYYGFPPETYNFKYPCPGNPELAQEIKELLIANRIEAKLEDKRGYDHGVFVPLLLMYPAADIPCIQVSLHQSLDPSIHIKIGESLAPLLDRNILFLGSGYSFHNMHAFFNQKTMFNDPANDEFQKWLKETCSEESLSDSDRTERLINWTKGPNARYCHPREEHLLPLHVCFGIKKSKAKIVFEDDVFGKKALGMLW